MWLDWKHRGRLYGEAVARSRGLRSSSQHMEERGGGGGGAVLKISWTHFAVRSGAHRYADRRHRAVPGGSLSCL